MFNEIRSNKKAIDFFKKELILKRDSGTYLFYGVDRELLKDFAKIFAKSLNCIHYIDDFCGECDSCKAIENESYGDLEIIEDSKGIKIDKIRELVYSSSTTSYSGKKKIYIIRDIQKLRKESANALLKLIEEPTNGSFYILTASSLNILSTIKSRTILLNIEKESAKEMNVTDYEYNFFLGNSKEIKEYKKVDGYDLTVEYSFENIGEAVKNWLDTGNFIYKMDIYKSITDFIKTKDYMTLLDKIFFVNELILNGADRELIKEIMSYTSSSIGKNIKNLEKVLEIKSMERATINLKNLLITFYTNV